jgi:hypothetical protein
MENSTVNSNHLPTIGRVSSFGHYYRDEMDSGEKKTRKREARKSEKRQWMLEVEEELDDE